MEKKKRIPRHIGVIPDGNRRWANLHGMKKEEGYEYGLLPGEKLLRDAREAGVEEITYYGFTVNNCKRPKEQVAAFQKACVEAVNRIGTESVDLLVTGNMDSDCFPKELEIYRERKAIHGGGMRVNFLVNYGWEWDVAALQEGSVLHSNDISRLDLIIRWGGRRRLSGFLPIQSVYADLYIEEKLWPDYTKSDLERALAWYQLQDITLGG